MLPSGRASGHGRMPETPPFAALPPSAVVNEKRTAILPAHRRSLRAPGTLTHRIAVGVLCTATATAAALGIFIRRFLRAHGTLTHRIALGVLCTATATAAALGISMQNHPSPTT